ncbi:hypothetical protein OIU74_020047 [Salix koriyanagi]|uniref:Uncharacterized protein n=1 Tax=Salix koriyanagi TaxID=2511006 RepID=A0A9Q0P505_9ROSI|nr:hypothetical protein OIU74_020047 [Salix koriyanagi]
MMLLVTEILLLLLLDYSTSFHVQCFTLQLQLPLYHVLVRRHHSTDQDSPPAMIQPFF